MPDKGDSGVRAPACIHVDLDSVWATAASCGVEMDMDPDPILQTSVGRFISIFAEHRVRATFFITGRDAGRRSNAPLIAALRSAGHEIANHSMAHRPNFTGLPAREIEADIADSTKAVEDAVGERCLGFRAPTYNVNGAVLRRLEGLGYLYDSSILPTFISPLYRAANRLAGGRAFPYGDPRHWAAPLVPYHPDEARVWRRGGMRIAEVPISTMPLPSKPINITPNKVPMIEPAPPAKLVPPMITAAITSNSSPSAMFDEPDMMREDSSTAAKAARKPITAKVVIRVRATRMPDRRAASSLPPTL